jgi:hypothetical protein
MHVAKDIELYINKVFIAPESRREVYKILEPILTVDWNVGADQLVRSLLYLSDGSLETLKGLANFEDPRDVIMRAESKSGNTGDYFTSPFNPSHYE